MLISNACKEVVEGLLLFMGNQYEHLSSLTTRTLQPHLTVTIIAMEMTAAETHTWSVRVDASDLGVYYLDGKLFLTKLCERGSNIRSVLSAVEDITGEIERGELTVYSRKIGDYSTVHRHTLILSQDGDSINSNTVCIQESVLSRPSDFPPSGLRISFKMGGYCVRDMKREAHRLSLHMHLLHLINHNIELSLLVKTESEVLLTSHLPRENGGWCPLPTSPYTIITSIHHFLNSVATTKQVKLKLSRGMSYTLPLSSLKLYCSAAVVPHLSVCKGRKIPANRICKHLQVYVFGPGGVPVSGVGTLSISSLTSLADWDNYGLSLTSVNNSTPDDVMMTSSGYCHLNDNRVTMATNQQTRQSRVKRDRSLVLFIFLEDTTTTVSRGSVGHSTTGYWGKQLERLCGLRGMVDELLQTHRRKFRQATHSVLNKLLCNYGTHIKTASIMHTALPLLAATVATIIKQSTNETFKQTCKDTLRTEDETEEECIAEELWNIAEEKLHITKTHTAFPNEPLSPELEHAVLENSSTESTTILTTSTTDQTSSTRLHMVPTGTTVEPITTQYSDQQQSSQLLTEVTERKSSLFEAMINSSKRRAKRNVDTIPQSFTASLTSSSLSSQEIEDREREGGTSEVGENQRQTNFDSLADILVIAPSSTEQDNNISVLSNTPTTITAAATSLCDSLTETHDSCFEELGAEDCTILQSQYRSTTSLCETEEDTMFSTRLTYNDGSDTEMDWGDAEQEEEEDGDFEEMGGDGFSDFPTSDDDSECEGNRVDMIQQQQLRETYHHNGIALSQSELVLATGCDGREDMNDASSKLQDSISLLNNSPSNQAIEDNPPNIVLPTHPTNSTNLPTSATTVTSPVTNTTAQSSTTSTQCEYTTTDSDWEMLGDLEEGEGGGQVEERGGAKHSHPQKLLAESVRQQQEGDHNDWYETTPTVPDINNCSFDTYNNIIDDNDFQWE